MENLNSEIMESLFDGELIEYKIFEIVDKNKNKILEEFNLLGQQGWEYCDKLNSNLILFKRLRNYFDMIEKAREIIDNKSINVKENKINKSERCDELCDMYDIKNEFCNYYKVKCNYGSDCLDN